MSKSPTSWTINPLASTSNVIEYDNSKTPYDDATQPYDGYSSSSPSPTSIKNPTAYTPLSELYQQYYGGPTEVPLYAAPRHWVANPYEFNETGQYTEGMSAEANLYPYDQSTREYDQTALDYDGTNDGKSFASWKNATGWTPITGGNL